MPRYDIYLQVLISVTITVEADNEEQAEKKWASFSGALEEAKLAAAEEVKELSDYEFDVELVSLHEDDE